MSTLRSFIIVCTSPKEKAESVDRAIKSFGNWWHCIPNLWIVRCPGTLEEIDKTLQPIQATDVSYFITEIAGEVVWANLETQAAGWLRDNLVPKGTRAHARKNVRFRGGPA